MIATLIILCISNLLILSLAFGIALSHRKLIDFMTRRFYDLELALKNENDD